MEKSLHGPTKRKRKSKEGRKERSKIKKENKAIQGMDRYTCRRKEMQQENWNRAEGRKAKKNLCKYWTNSVFKNAGSKRARIEGHYIDKTGCIPGSRPVVLLLTWSYIKKNCDS